MLPSFIYLSIFPLEGGMFSTFGYRLELASTWKQEWLHRFNEEPVKDFSGVEINTGKIVKILGL